jgi:hypothetical protein
MPLRSLCVLVSLLCGTSIFAAETNAPTEYLSDRPELLVAATQAWGELGFNVAAHASGVPGQPLQIAGKSFSKGLGHHASGALVFALDGQYASFDAQVGLQACHGGSVVFRVLVDGHPRFDSGMMTDTRAAKPVHVDLTGAYELQLEAADAGDGIGCDMANWADARLTRASAGTPRTAESHRVDVAPFARVVTSDPHRKDGARASRIEEYRAEDLFLESELQRNRNGTYAPPIGPQGMSCIGLQFLNNRVLREVGIEFADPKQIPESSSIQLEVWSGESAWQGTWKPLKGSVALERARAIYRLAAGDGVVQTRKVRWLFPAKTPVRILSLSAYTRSRWAPAELTVYAEGEGRGWLRVDNGEILSPVVASQEAEFKMGEGFPVTVLASTPSLLNSDPTVLQFQFGDRGIGVAVQDVLSNKQVYVPALGLVVADASAPPVTIEDCKQQVTRTVLEQVREMPEQTREQAMTKTHHAAQRDGPVMLSLSCDNRKFVVERDGVIRFVIGTNVSASWIEEAGELRPRFGTGEFKFLSRTLDGGWLPIPLTVFEASGMQYSERAFVAPISGRGTVPRPESICVVEFTVTNVSDKPAGASLGLDVLSKVKGKTQATLSADKGAFQAGDTLVKVFTEESSVLRLDLQNGQAFISGTLPAKGFARAWVFLSPTSGPDHAALQKLNPAKLREDTEHYWKSVLAPALQVDTPDPWLNDLIKSSQVRCLITARNEAEGARIAPWIAAINYGPLESEAHSVIRGMDFMGHTQFAERSLDYFIHRYNTNGFLTTGYTTFGTAWHLWTLGEHCALTGPTAWSERVAPEITRAGNWIIEQMEKTRAEGLSRPEHGLMPPGVLADWNAYAYHFAMNGYYYAALTELSHVLARSQPLSISNAIRFVAKADDLRACIVRSYRWTQARSPVVPLRNGTWVPHYPSQVHSPGKLAEFFPGQDAGRSWCYDVELGAHQLVPTGVFEPDDPEVITMLDHMEDRQFLADGWFDYPASLNEQDWFNLGGFSKVQPYYTRNAEIYAMRDDIAPFIRSYFNTLASLVNPEVLTFWEHFNHSGAWDKTHETGYFLHQTRTMLLTERNDELWLAPLVTTNWLGNAMSISVSNAPSRFGIVSYRIDSDLANDRMHASIKSPTRTPPRQIVLRLRHPQGKPIQQVMVNGAAHSRFDGKKSLIYLNPISRSRFMVEASY